MIPESAAVQTAVQTSSPEQNAYLHLQSLLSFSAFYISRTLILQHLLSL